MTGLEKSVPIHPGPKSLLRRYLTPFDCITLGLALILALGACSPKASPSPDPTATLASPGVATSPPSFGTQALRKGTATPLPPIPATPNESTPSPLGVTAAQLRGMQVNLWYPWGGAGGDSFREIVDGFNRSNQWGIQVNATGYGDYGLLDDAMATAITSGSLPDVVVDYGYQARSWDLSNVLAPLNPYLEDPVWGLTPEEQADFYPAFWSEDLTNVGYEGQAMRLGIPYYRSAYVLFYNQTWAEELGYPTPPTTPEDFRVRACAAVEAVKQGGDKTALGKGGWLVTSTPGALLGWIYAFGASITAPNDQGYLFNTPSTSQAFEYLKGLLDSGCAWTATGIDVQAAFESRQALFVVGSLQDIPAQAQAFAKSGSTDHWVVIPFPSTDQPVVVTYGPSLFLTKASPDRQLAGWLVIEWLVYPPNQAEFVQEQGVYPSRVSTGYSLVTEDSFQWGQAIGLLPDARSEPSLASWSMVQWALSDASTQLFSQKFTADQVPALIGELDSVAQEIFSQVH